MEGIGPLFTCIRDLCIRAWFATVKNIAIDVLLGASFIERCLRWIFSRQQRVDRWHSQPVVKIRTKKWINSIHAEISVLHVRSNSIIDTVSNDTISWPASNHITGVWANDSSASLSRRWAHEHWDSPKCRWTRMFHDHTWCNRNSIVITVSRLRIKISSQACESTEVSL